MTTVVPLSKTGTTDLRVTAVNAATAVSPFAAQVYDRGLPAFVSTDGSVGSDQTKTIGSDASETPSVTGTAQTASSSPLFDSLVAAALRQEQEVTAAPTVAQTGSTAANAYAATAERAQTETQWQFGLDDIQTPGMLRQQASGRILDLIV